MSLFRLSSQTLLSCPRGSSRFTIAVYSMCNSLSPLMSDVNVLLNFSMKCPTISLFSMIVLSSMASALRRSFVTVLGVEWFGKIQQVCVDKMRRFAHRTAQILNHRDQWLQSQPRDEIANFLQLIVLNNAEQKIWVLPRDDVFDSRAWSSPIRLDQLRFHLAQRCVESISDGRELFLDSDGNVTDCVANFSAIAGDGVGVALRAIAFARFLRPVGLIHG
ncbi:hypothetical protein HDK90DRAFT_477446, partial [Phyllosticta capitalensis]